MSWDSSTCIMPFRCVDRIEGCIIDDKCCCQRERVMAEKPLVDVPRSESVTAAEVEQFKMERFAEKEFLSKLRVLVDDLSMKLTPRNAVLASMQRFLRNR